MGIVKTNSNTFSSVKISCQDKMSWIALLLREDSVNSSTMLIKLEHLLMALCVVLESFCL